MTERKTPVQQAVDLFFFAPLGLLMNAEQVIPELVEKGRQQVTMARMFGQFAVQQGQTEAGKFAAKFQEQAMSVADQLNQRANRMRPAPFDHAAGPAPAAEGNGASSGATQTSAPVAKPQHDGPAAATLAITDYDSLSASQVVPRLDSLSTEELDAVRAYESAHRGRKTILSKIDQLRA